MSHLSNEVPVFERSIVTEVPAGSRAVLKCNSNDYHHNFMLWVLENATIGPENSNYDESKYKYEVLSGKLHINNVTPQESGLYKCLSKKIDGSSIDIAEVQMIVTGGSSSTAIEAVKFVAIVASIIVIIACAVIYWRLRRDWNKYDGRMVIPIEADDEDQDDGDEIYNRTTTTLSPSHQPVPGPSRNQSSDLLYGMDNQGLDTDFNSVFENIQIKTPQGSLI